jgi:hypothetical protein
MSELGGRTEQFRIKVPFQLGQGDDRSLTQWLYTALGQRGTLKEPSASGAATDEWITAPAAMVAPRNWRRDTPAAQLADRSGRVDLARHVPWLRKCCV